MAAAEQYEREIARQFRLAQLDEDRPIMDRFPAFSALALDRAGYLWVRMYSSPTSDQDTVRWLVFDAMGAFSCHARVPDAFQIYEIGRDYMLGEVRDELNVEHVRLYRLHRPESTAT